MDQKGGNLFQKLKLSALDALNDTLIRAILFKVLHRFDCLNDAPKKYPFPLFPVQYTEEFQVEVELREGKGKGMGKKDIDKEVKKRIQQKKSDGDLTIRNIEDYEYYRPLFVNIFSGEQTTGVNIRTKEYNKCIATTWGQQKWFDDEIIKDGSDDTRKPIFESRGDYYHIFWTKIYGQAEPPIPPLNLEIRKKLARRLFLNVQILVLYWQLIEGSRVFFGDPKIKPRIIKKEYFLQALGFLIDNKKTTSWTDIRLRGFTTDGNITIDSTDGQGKVNETDANRNKKVDTWREKSIEEYDKKEKRHEKCIFRRENIFGWLFQKSDNTLNDVPDWFRPTSPDEQIQRAYHEIVRKLLPEYILTAAGTSGSNDDYLESEIKFPIPEVCSDIATDGNCNTWKTIGDPDGASLTQSSYIINNAARIYPSEDKMGELRFNFYNLTGEQVRNAQYCPLSSVADSMSLCTLGDSAGDITRNRMVMNNMNVTVTYNDNDNPSNNFYNLAIIPEKMTNEMKANYQIILDLINTVKREQFTKNVKTNEDIGLKCFTFVDQNQILDDELKTKIIDHFKAINNGDGNNKKYYRKK